MKNPLTKNTPSTQPATEMSPDETMRYLVSHPQLISSYGSDVASSFVSTLRDESLDPMTQTERIREKRNAIIAVIADLDLIIEPTNGNVSIPERTQMLAKSTRDTLSILVQTSETLAAMQDAQRITDAVQDVVDIMQEPNTHLVYARSEHRSFANRTGRTIERRDRISVRHVDPQGNIRKQLISVVIGIIETIMVCVAVAFGMNIVAIIITALLIAVVAGVLINRSIAATDDIAVISTKKFNNFVANCSKYSITEVRKYLGMDQATPDDDYIINSTALKNWVIEAAPVFDVLNPCDIEQYTKPKPGIEQIKKKSRKTRSDVNLALDKLAASFDEALVTKNAIYAEIENTKIQDARREALKKIEENKRLRAFIDKRERVLQSFLNDEDDTDGDEKSTLSIEASPKTTIGDITTTTPTTKEEFHGTTR